MPLRLIALLCTVLLFGSAVTHAQTEHWIDLTHELSSDAVFWPTADPFKMTTDFEGMTEGGYYYSAYSFTTAEHGGTHIDAPVHFAKGMHSVDEIPLEHLIGAAVVVDVTSQVSRNRDHLISVADLQGWEASHGEIPKRSIVLLRTGFSSHWPNARKYLGTELRGAAGAAAPVAFGLISALALFCYGASVAFSLAARSRG